MKVEFLNRHSGNRSLILIFAGWSTLPSLYADVSRKGWDTAVVYDYSQLETDFTFLNQYSTIWLFAWSLGVKAAALSLPAGKITAAYAINGTLTPVDNNYGIPVDIYNGTADNLDARNLKKFRCRMTSDSETFRQKFDTEFNEEEISDLKKQLYVIRDRDNKISELPWRRAYISTADRIFPTHNMLESWKIHDVETVLIKGDHYIPLNFITNAVIPDTEKIAARFSSAANTYDRNASAQRKIAAHLTELIKSYHICKNPEILEIGPGTGLFTRMYSSELLPLSLDFVDIVNTPEFGLAKTENYYISDAEKWMEENIKIYDGIFSASVIQWFINTPLFIKHCMESLKPGGVLAISTFCPGNLGELDNLRPSPISYPQPEKIREWLSPYFEDIYIETDEIKLEFRSHRELMLHLKHTGVGGSAPSAGLTQSALSEITTLTYRPLYIVCRKICRKA